MRSQFFLVLASAATSAGAVRAGDSPFSVQHLLRQRASESSTETETFSRALLWKTDPSEEGCGEAGKFVQPEEVFTPGSAPPSVIGVGSCWKPGAASKAAMENLVQNVRPDLQLWIGDQIYGDTVDPAKQKEAYKVKKNECDFRPFLDSRIPSTAIWDDHDFGDNNMVKYHPTKDQSQRNLLEHFDVPESSERYQRRGVYHSLRTGNPESGRVHIVLLDNRYHHSATFKSMGPCEGDNSTILGNEQWEWLENELETVESEVLIIASGLQVLPATYRDWLGKGNLGWSKYIPEKYCAWDETNDGAEFLAAIDSLGESEMYAASNQFFESWGEIPMERNRLLRLIQKAVHTGKTKLPLIASGDIHFGTMLKMTVPATEEYGSVDLYELTASGFSQKPDFFADLPSSYQFVKPVMSGTNFGSFEINWAASSVTMKLHTETTVGTVTHEVLSPTPFGLNLTNEP